MGDQLVHQPQPELFTDGRTRPGFHGAPIFGVTRKKLLSYHLVERGLIRL